MVAMYFICASCFRIFVSACEVTGKPKGDQPGSAEPSKLTRPPRSKELAVKSLLTAKFMSLRRVGMACEPA